MYDHYRMKAVEEVGATIIRSDAHSTGRFCGVFCKAEGTNGSNIVAMTDRVDERVLVERFNGGDDGAFERIVEIHSEGVGGLANRLLCWGGDVEDVVQDVFLAAFVGLKKFRFQCSLKTWLFTITINKCRTLRYRRILRLRRVRPKAVEDCAVDEDTAGRVLDAERFAGVRRAVEQLPMRYREAVVLRYLEELETDEIARVLGICSNTLQVRLSRARKLLRGHLAGIIEEDEL